MIKNVLVISGEDTVLDTAKMMEKYDVGLLVVVEDMLTRHPIGVLSDRDIITKVIIKSLNPAKTCVKDIMTKNIIAANSNEELQKAIEILEKR